MNLFKTYNFLIYKLTSRYRKGFGVHSPFVFDFINNVLNEKNPYYTYPQIDALNYKYKQINRLLFRMVSYYKCKNILIIGENDDFQKVIRLINNNIMIEQGSEVKFANSDFIYIAEKELKKIDDFYKNNFSKDLIIICQGIYNNHKNKILWNKLLQNNFPQILIDIFEIGIIFVRKDLKQQFFKIIF